MKKIFYIYFLFLVVFFMFSSLEAFTANIDPDEYIVKAGDLFFIQASMLDSLFVRSSVLPAGGLNLFPFADSVRVAGMTLNEAYVAIHNKINQGSSNNRFLVQLGAISPIRFSVTGAVVRPGGYVSPDMITLQYAINIAGGFASSASKDVRVQRRGEILSFNLNDFYSKSDPTVNPFIMQDDVIMVSLAETYVRFFIHNDTQNFMETVEFSKENETIAEAATKMLYRLGISNIDEFTINRNDEYFKVGRDFVLQPFDRIYITPQEFYIYVTGYVARPGRLPFNGFGDAFYYISQSGGPTPNGTLSKIYIVREEGKRELYKGQNIEPGDTIYVPESFRSVMVSWLVPASTAISLIYTLVIIGITIR